MLIYKIKGDRLVNVAMCKRSMLSCPRSLHAVDRKEGLIIVSIGSCEDIWDLSIFKKLKNMTHVQIKAILNVLSNMPSEDVDINAKAHAYDKIKQIFNNIRSKGLMMKYTIKLLGIIFKILYEIEPIPNLDWK